MLRARRCGLITALTTYNLHRLKNVAVSNEREQKN